MAEDWSQCTHNGHTYYKFEVDIFTIYLTPFPEFWLVQLGHGEYTRNILKTWKIKKVALLLAQYDAITIVCKFLERVTNRLFIYNPYEN